VAATDPIQRLSLELKTEWPAIAAAGDASATRMHELDEALKIFTTEDTSIVVFGSLARSEFTSGSDLDWILLVDGIADPAHLDAFQKIETYLNEEPVKGPGAEATFGGLVFSHDLINYIGGGEDTNANLTQCMLLLLESACIGRSDAYHRVINNVLKRYIHEDFGWMKGWNSLNVPRFLQNDMARYWRTLAVDFAYKRRKRAGRGWALRTAKLRLSRKLTYAAGLVMCFSCSINSPSIPHSNENQIESFENKMESAALAFVAHLSECVQMTPLAVFANLFLQHKHLAPVANRMFRAYNEFLLILNDIDKRSHLDNLVQSKVADDPLYGRVRELGHEFQGSLDSIFLDSVDFPEYYNLTKTYGVF
jgi:predicted nucleotidyltransferase